MRKNKKEQTPEQEAAKITEQRNQTIRDFNMNNAGSAWIDANRIPTDEEKVAVKEAFENAVKNAKENSNYLIADADNALRVAKFIYDFNMNGIWIQKAWVGVMNLAATLKKFIDEYKEGEELRLDRGATTFIFNVLENYGGIGYESAKHMADIWDEYVPIYDTVRGHVENMQLEADYINRLQEMWNLMEQGYYYIMLDTDKYRAIGIDVFNPGAKDKKEEVLEPEVVEKNK